MRNLRVGGYSILSASDSERGGYKEIIFRISGKGVFSYLKFESGVHRVQRVPETESQGRVHTSAASVAVLPEAEEVDITVRAEDIRIDTMRSSGGRRAACQYNRFGGSYYPHTDRDCCHSE